MLHYTRRIPIIVLALAFTAACGDTASAPVAPTVERTLSAEELTALPVDTLALETQICLATGYDACPLRFAMATRLDDSRIALWEPGRTIGIITAGDSAPRALGSGGGPGSAYGTAMAIRPDGKGYEIIDVQDGMFGIVRLDTDGTPRGRTPMPQAGPLASVGYSAGELVMQDFSGWELGESGKVTVRRLDSPTDTVGTLLLDAPVRWMTGGSENGPPPRPFFAGSPLWTRLPGGDMVWSPGTSFRIERRGPLVTGAVAWTLTGPDGPPVTAEDMEMREATIREAVAGLPFSDEEFDGMRTRSDSLVPPVSAFIPNLDGSLLVMGALSPSQPTATWIKLDAEGVPVSRFELDTRARVLLAEGDSILVHRPTESEPWEIVWMTLKR